MLDVDEMYCDEPEGGFEALRASTDDPVEVEVLVSPGEGSRLETLLAALGDRDWRIRRAAASAIPDLDPHAVSEALFELLASEDAGERNAAIKAFVRMGSPALEYLLPGLRADDADVRNFCSLALGLIGDHGATEHIVSALDVERDPNVRYMLVEALGRLNDPVAVPCLLRALEEDAWIKAPAVDALGRLRCSEAVTALTRVLSDPEVGGVAADALARMRDVRAVLPLARIAGASDGMAATVFIEALARILGSPGQDGPLLTLRLRPLLSAEEAEALIEVIAGELRHARTAAHALVVADWLNEPKLLPHVVGAMSDVALHDHGLRLVARFIGKVDPASVPPIAAGASAHALQVVLEAVAAVGYDGDTCWIEEQLANANPLVAASAARALGVAGEPAAGNQLLRLLSHPLDEVRLGAAEGLGALGPDNYADSLLAIVEHGSSEDRLAVARVLQGRRGWNHEELRRTCRLLAADTDPMVRAALARTMPNAPGDIADMLAARLTLDPDPNVRRATYDALGRVGSPGARVYLRGLLADDDVSVRVSALNCMTVSPDPSDYTSYYQAAADPDPRVRIAAYNGLAHVGRPDAVPLIRKGLDESDPDLFCAALKALLTSSPSEAAVVAIGASYAPDWHVRAAAIDVLRSVGGDSARDAVRRALSDGDWDVRRAAISVCPRVLGTGGVAELMSLVEDVEVGGDAEDALLQVACDAPAEVLRHLEDAAGKQRSALLRIASTVIADEESVLVKLLESASAEDRFYASLGLTDASEEAMWELKHAMGTEEDDGVKLVMSAVVAARARTAGTPHA